MRTGISVLAVLAVLLWATLVPTLTSRGTLRREAIAAAGFVLAAWTSLALVGPGVLPTSWLLVLHEGTEAAIHSGIGHPHPFLRASWLGDLSPWRATVQVHLFEGTLSIALLWVLSVARLGRLAGTIVVVAWTASPWFVQSHLSEGPQPTMIWLTLMAAHGLGALHAPRARTRWVAVGLIATATLAATLLRFELAGLGGGVLLAAAFVAARPGQAAALGERLEQTGAALLLGVVVLLTSLGLYAVAFATPRIDPLAARIMPDLPWSTTQLATLRWHVDLLGYTAPTVAVLAFIGFLVAPTRGVVGLAGSASVLLLARVYASVSHLGQAPYETLRYDAGTLGAVGVLAVVGAAWVRERTADARWPWVLAAVGIVLPRPLAPPEVSGPPWHLVHSSHQVSARFLHETLVDHGACLLVSRWADRVVDARGPQPDWTFAMRTVFMAGPLGRHRVLDGPRAAETLDLPRSEDPAAVLDALRTREGCVRFVHGFDCNLGGADCDRWVEGLEALDTREVAAPAHNVHHGAAPGSILHLGVYAVP